VGAQTLSHSVLMAGGAKLREAVTRGDTAEVRRLVQSGAHVDGGGGFGPLYRAAWKGHVETAKTLLELGATVNGLYHSSTPLHEAARNCHAGDILMLPATGSPTQFHAPTQRREGRECGPYDCGAVRMCACHGLEQGGVQRDVTANPTHGTPNSRPVQHSPHTGLSQTPAPVRSPVRLTMTGPTPVCRCGNGAARGGGGHGGHHPQRQDTTAARHRCWTHRGGAGAEAVSATPCDPADVACRARDGHTSIDA
jgi:hypothetical protein